MGHHLMPRAEVCSAAVRPRTATCRWLTLLLLTACASAPGPAPNSSLAATETAPPTTVFGNQELPPFPQPLGEMSSELRAAVKLARGFLGSTKLVPFQGGDQAAFESWMNVALPKWMGATATELAAAQTALVQLPDSSAEERILASTLIGLCYQHFTDEFVSAPQPPVLAGKPEQLQSYRDGLAQVSAEWIDKARQAFAFCAIEASAEQAPALQAYSDFCAQRRDALDKRLAVVVANAKQARAKQAAAEAQAAGPRPPGSEACWSPRVGSGPEPARNEATKPVPALVQIDPVEPSRIPLMAAERLALGTAIRELLSARYQQAGLEVHWLTDAELRALDREWRAGRPRTGARPCARATTRHQFLRASMPNLEAVNVWAQCDDEGAACRLQVDLGAGAVASALGVRRLSAPLQQPLSRVDGWLAASAQLAPPAPGSADQMLGSLRGRWRAAPGERFALHAAKAHGAWSDPRSARATVASAGPELAACHSANDGELGDLLAVVDLAPDGRVSALSINPSSQQARRRNRCVGAALKKLKFEPSEPGTRRVSLSLSLGEGHGRDPRDQRYGARHLLTGVRVAVSSEEQGTVSPLPLSGSPLASRLAHCIDDHGGSPQGTFELSAELKLSGDGHVRGSKLTPLPESGAKPAGKLAKCLKRAIKQTRFSCTADGKPTTGRATLCLRHDP